MRFRGQKNNHHTQTSTHNHRREENKLKSDCTHTPSQTQKGFELVTTNDMKRVKEQIHNTWVPNMTPGSCMSLHKEWGGGGRMNFTETSAPDYSRNVGVPTEGLGAL